MAGHHTRVDSFSMVGREANNITRTIKEVIYIRVSDSSINKNFGKFQLSHTSDEVLFNTPNSISNNPLPTTFGPHPLLVGSGAAG